MNSLSRTMTMSSQPLALLAMASQTNDLHRKRIYSLSKTLILSPKSLIPLALASQINAFLPNH